MKLAKIGIPALATAVALASGMARADGDSAAGAKVYKKCQTCHSIEAGVNKVGPSLAGVIGRAAGTAEGLKFSDAMAGSGVVWDESTLDHYLADPKAFIPGNKMTSPGLKKEDDRENVIAYIKGAAQ